MLGPVIMLNEISRLLLTANIVKAKLHILTHTYTHAHVHYRANFKDGHFEQRTL